MGSNPVQAFQAFFLYLLKGPSSPKRPCTRLLLFTNASIVQSCDLNGLPEYSRWCENLCIQIQLLSLVAPIYLNLLAPTKDIYSPKYWNCLWFFV